MGQNGSIDGLTGFGTASDAAAVSQDGDPARTNLQSLVVSAPDHAPGVVDVEVRTAEGSCLLPGAFTYLEPDVPVPGIVAD
jgi:hypothetical protein